MTEIILTGSFNLNSIFMSSMNYGMQQIVTSITDTTISNTIFCTGVAVEIDGLSEDF